MIEVLIRPARDDDAMEVSRLHVQVWNEAYAGLLDPDVLARRSAVPLEERAAMWRGRFAATPSYVAEAAYDRLVGFATAGTGRDSDAAGVELMTLYVTAAVYGTGTGHRLLLAAIGEKPAYLWVIDGNERAIRFYQRHGFRFDGATRQDPPYGSEYRTVCP